MSDEKPEGYDLPLYFGEPNGLNVRPRIGWAKVDPADQTKASIIIDDEHLGKILPGDRMDTHISIDGVTTFKVEENNEEKN